MLHFTCVFSLVPRLLRVKKCFPLNNNLVLLADFQFGTSTMVATDFERLVGYSDEGQVPLQAYDCVLAEFSRLLFVLHVRPYIQSLPTP